MQGGAGWWGGRLTYVDVPVVGGVLPPPANLRRLPDVLHDEAPEAQELVVQLVHHPGELLGLVLQGGVLGEGDVGRHVPGLEHGVRGDGGQGVNDEGAQGGRTVKEFIVIKVVEELHVTL